MLGLSLSDLKQSNWCKNYQFVQHPLWVKTISRKSLSKQTLPVEVLSIQNVWPTLFPLYENMTFLSGAREYTNSCPWFTAGSANVSSDITWKVKKDKNASQHFSEEKNDFLRKRNQRKCHAAHFQIFSDDKAKRIAFDQFQVLGLSFIEMMAFRIRTSMVMQLTKLACFGKDSLRAIFTCSNSCILGIQLSISIFVVIESSSAKFHL